MSLVIDGERSKKRLHIGKKLVSQARELGVPSLTTVRNGFRIKGWQMDGLEKVTISAPMGAAVLRSSNDGVFLSTADYWAGGFSPGRKLHIANDMPDADDGMYLIVFTWGGYEYNSIETVSGDLDVNKTAPYPNAAGLGLEAVLCDVSVITPKDPTADSGTYYDQGGQHLLETSLIGYGSDWSNKRRYGDLRDYSKSLRDTVYPAGSGYASSLPFLWKLPTTLLDRTVLTAINSYRLDRASASSEDYEYVSHTITERASDGSYRYDTVHLADMVLPDMPQKLFDEIAITTFCISPVIQGSYVFTPSIDGPITVLQASYMGGNYSGWWDEATEDGTPRSDFEEWHLFFTIRTVPYVGGVTTVTNFHGYTFVDLLDELSGGRILDAAGDVADWQLAMQILSDLLPRPNYKSWTPYDSVMFNDDTDIYTWTRRDGGFRFSASTGLTRATIAVPSEVTDTDGVRPDITYAGNGMYLCVCFAEWLHQPENFVPVKGVYYGSPFTGWTRLPETKLVYVRPVVVTETEIRLIGIIREEVDIDGVTHLRNRFATYYRDLTVTPEVDEWKRMGLLEYEGNANWSACLYGAGSMVYPLKRYLSQPCVIHALPCHPYADYEGFAP